MTFGMIVQLPVSVAFGTDEEFDLRVRLERVLTVALAEACAGECTGGEIDTSHMKFHLSGIPDPAPALAVTKAVLARCELLGCAVVALELSCEADPDDRDWKVLWPPNYVGACPVA